MAYDEYPPILGSLQAAVDLSGSQFCAVKLDTNGNVELCGAGQMPIGVLQNKPEADQACNIWLAGAGGATKVKLGGSVSKGDALASDANGAIVAGTDDTKNFAIALQAGSSGEYITALLQLDYDVAQGACTIAIPIPAMSGIADGDLVTQIQPGFAGRIIALEFLCTTAVTTAAKTTTLNAEIGTVNCTGSLTVAGTYAVGATARAAVTAANTFDEHDVISIEAASTTTFIEGAGLLLIHIDRTPDVTTSGVAVISIPFPAMSAIADGDLVTEITPGFAGRIYALEFVCTTAVTTAAKTTTLNAEIGTTNCGGSLTVAGTYALGATERAQITSPNEFSATDKISIEAASTTTFVEGAGVLLIYVDRIPYDTALDSSIVAVDIPDLNAIADGDLVTDLLLDYPGRIIAIELVCTGTGTPGAGTTTINMEIGTTNCGGTLVAVDDAYDTYGSAQRAAITAPNEFTVTDTLSVELASTTVFPSGCKGVLLIYIDHVRSE